MKSECALTCQKRDGVQTCVLGAVRIFKCEVRKRHREWPNGIFGSFIGRLETKVIARKQL